MADSHRTALNQLLTDSSSEEWQLAAQVLHQAFTWCATVTDLPSMEDPEVALDFLMSLKQAIQQGDAWLSTLDALIEHAAPGQTLRHALDQRRAAVAAGAHQLSELSGTVAALQQAEAALRQQVGEREALVAQHAALEARLPELQRLQRLAQEVDGLRSQVECVERNRSAAEEETEQLEAQLAQQTEQFLLLSKAQMTHLRADVRALLPKAKQRHAAIAQTRRQWQEDAARYAELDVVLQKEREVLSLYRAADQMIADALGDQPEVQSAQALLQKVGRFLEQADAILARVLEAQARAEEAQKLFVAGGSA
ncbi:MAG: hypothetical protein EI684_09255 [Candidatus Viridilinea halotolerans]|uniref:Uncharacterized protein n=1 Tax=Candidatus Viridilinea halotolerans TaxID=2491704 RepID=A0A426U1A7_9CHLR|nr:MAG: hypothetical protein EI684_09255 [Candidatus Viridilinea halotolerans]